MRAEIGMFMMQQKGLIEAFGAKITQAFMYHLEICWTNSSVIAACELYQLMNFELSLW